MNFWLMMLLYIGGVGGFVSILIFGKQDGNSFFDKMYRVVCIHFPETFKHGLRCIFGEWAVRAVDATWEYVVWRNNPLVQLFYVHFIFYKVTKFCSNVYVDQKHFLFKKTDWGFCRGLYRVH